MITLDPNLTANFAPIEAPIKAPPAITRAIGKMTYPLMMKIDKEPRLQATFANLVYDKALTSLKPNNITNATMKNEPTPGPKTPS